MFQRQNLYNFRSLKTLFESTDETVSPLCSTGLLKMFVALKTSNIENFLMKVYFKNKSDNYIINVRHLETEV